MDHDIPQSHTPDDGAVVLGGAARWVQVIGAVFLGLGVLFLMALIVLSILNHRVLCDDRWLVGVLLSLLLAIGAGFLGGHAAARGSIPLGGQPPLRVSIVGGGAVFVIILAVFQALVPGCAPAAGSKLTIQDLEIRPLAEGATLDVSYRAEGTRSDQRLYVRIRNSSGGLLLDRRLEHIDHGRALVTVANASSTLCVTLDLLDPNDSIAASSAERCKQWKES